MKKGLNSSSVLRAFLGAIAIFLCQSLSGKPVGHGVGWGLTLTSPGIVVTNIAARGDHSLALRNDGTVISWGNASLSPKSAGNVVAISAGFAVTGSYNQFGLALTTNGTILGWSDSTYGQGETPPAGLSNVVAISAGGRHALALKSDGTTVAWGSIGYYLPVFGNTISVSAGENGDLILKSDGTAILWPSNPPYLPDSNNIVAIAAGYYHHLGLKADGRVFLWQVAASQQLPDITNAVAIAIGEDASTYHVLALRNDGTVYTYGDNSYGQSTIPPGLSNVIAIAAGVHHSIALKSDGIVVCWGDNSVGQCNFPVPAKDIVGISAGARYNLALKKDGTVSDWAGNQTFPYGLSLSNITAVAAGNRNGLALRKNGTVVAWGNNQYSQNNLPFLLDKVAAIAVGPYHSFAVKSNGTVVVWGSNYGAPAGAGALPADLSNVVSVCTSAWIVTVIGGSSDPGDFALALRADGTVVAWGYNGTYNVGPTNVPPGLSNVISIAAGGGHGLALKSDSTVVGWGANSAGQATGVPTNRPPYASSGQVVISGQLLSNVVAIAAGFTHSLALKNDGTVVAWGANVNGEASVAAGVSNVVAISAGFYQSLAIIADLKIDSILIAPQGPVLDFHTFAGQQYSVEFSSDLAPGSWLPLPGGNVSGNGLDTEVLDSGPATALSRFYRLRLVP